MTQLLHSPEPLQMPFFPFHKLSLARTYPGTVRALRRLLCQRDGLAPPQSTLTLVNAEWRHLWRVRLAHATTLGRISTGSAVTEADEVGDLTRPLPSLTEAELTEDDALELARVLSALADPVRLRLVSLVASIGEVCSCDL